MLWQDMSLNKFVRNLILVLVRSPKVNSELSLRDDEKKSAWDFEMNNMKHAENIGYHNDAYI